MFVFNAALLRSLYVSLKHVLRGYSRVDFVNYRDLLIWVSFWGGFGGKSGDEVGDSLRF